MIMFHDKGELKGSCLPRHRAEGATTVSHNEASDVTYSPSKTRGGQGGVDTTPTEVNIKICNPIKAVVI